MEDKIKDIVNFIVGKEKEIEENIESTKEYWSSWIKNEIIRWEEEERKIRENFGEFLKGFAEEKRVEMSKKEKKLEEEFQKKKEEYRRKLEENYSKALEFLWEKIGE